MPDHNKNNKSKHQAGRRQNKVIDHFERMNAFNATDNGLFVRYARLLIFRVHTLITLLSFHVLQTPYKFTYNFIKWIVYESLILVILKQKNSLIVEK